jgi:hypothetical protein
VQANVGTTGGQVVLVVDDVVVEDVTVVVDEVVVDLAVVEEVVEDIVVVGGNFDASTARNSRTSCPLAAIFPASVRQSGAIDARRRTRCRLPHTGQRLVMSVPFRVTFTRARRSGHVSIPTSPRWKTTASGSVSATNSSPPWTT